MTRALALGVAWLSAASLPAMAQVPASAVVGDSIRVGDRVPVVVQLTVRPDDRVQFPDTIPLRSDDIENVARVRLLTDTLDDGRIQATGVYTVTPWRPGELAVPDLPILVSADGGEVATVTAVLPVLEVLSVLPADPATLEPRPAKGVIGPSFVWWLFALLGLVILALGALAWWWLRRRQPAPTLAAVPVAHPREQALAALEAARSAGLVERGEWKEFYTRVAHALRDYLEAVEPGWSEDLTTSELLVMVRATAGPEQGAALAALLRPADQVKFARRVPDAETAIAEWEAARTWVQRFERPRPGAPVEVAA